MPRTKSFLHEVHRHYGLPAIPMQTHVDIPFRNGYILPKKTNVLLLNRLMSRSKLKPSDRVPRGPNNDKAPHRFCPDRYLVADGMTNAMTCVHPHASESFGAFGLGLRTCPGRLYAESLSLLSIARILQEFEDIQLAMPRDPVFIWNIVMVPKDGVHLKLRPKSKID